MAGMNLAVLKVDYLLYTNNTILQLYYKSDRVSNSWLKFIKVIYLVMKILMNISECVNGRLLNKIGKL
jgi:hypothetical protein